MKREYKFRTWNLNNGMWRFDGYFIDNVDKHSSDIVIQQYTEMKDKNGKEIYDGDIISCYEHMGSGVSDYMRPISVVIWDGCSWCYSLDKTRNFLNPHQILRYARSPEVIGNIFETPHLIQ